MHHLLLGSLKPSLFQAEQAPFPQTLFICQVLQAPHHLGGPLLKVVRLFVLYWWPQTRCSVPDTV